MASTMVATDIQKQNLAKMTRYIQEKRVSKTAPHIQDLYAKLTISEKEDDDKHINDLVCNIMYNDLRMFLIKMHNLLKDETYAPPATLKSDIKMARYCVMNRKRRALFVCAPDYHNDDEVAFEPNDTNAKKYSMPVVGRAYVFYLRPETNIDDLLQFLGIHKQNKSANEIAKECANYYDVTDLVNTWDKGFYKMDDMLIHNDDDFDVHTKLQKMCVHWYIVHPTAIADEPNNTYILGHDNTFWYNYIMSLMGFTFGNYEPNLTINALAPGVFSFDFDAPIENVIAASSVAHINKDIINDLTATELIMIYNKFIMQIFYVPLNIYHDISYPLYTNSFTDYAHIGQQGFMFADYNVGICDFDQNKLSVFHARRAISYHEQSPICIDDKMFDITPCLDHKIVYDPKKMSVDFEWEHSELYSGNIMCSNPDCNKGNVTSYKLDMNVPDNKKMTYYQNIIYMMKVHEILNKVPCHFNKCMCTNIQEDDGYLSYINFYNNTVHNELYITPANK